MNNIQIGNTSSEKVMTIAQVSDCHLFRTEDKDISEWMVKRGMDNTTADAKHVWNEVKTASPDLVLFTGDLIDYFSSENLALVREIFDDINVPRHFSFGNHDLSDIFPPKTYKYCSDIERSKAVWAEYTGIKPGLNSFSMNGINFINLNIHDGAISPSDFDLLDRHLTENPAPSIVIGHWPLPIPEIKELIITSKNPGMLPVFLNPESKPIIEVLDSHPNVMAYICGHLHEASTFQRSHWKHISSAPAYHSSSWNRITVFQPEIAEN